MGVITYSFPRLSLSPSWADGVPVIGVPASIHVYIYIYIYMVVLINYVRFIISNFYKANYLVKRHIMHFSD